MTPKDFQKLRLRQLDRTFEDLRPLREIQRPPRGWLKAIREALGMTMEQAANRLGVTRSMISKYEKGEAEGSITLATLRHVAAALNSELVYAITPTESIESILKRRALVVARRRIESVHQSMALEEQATSKQEREHQVEELAKELLEEHPRMLWNEA